MRKMATPNIYRIKIKSLDFYDKAFSTSGQPLGESNYHYSPLSIHIKNAG